MNFQPVLPFAGISGWSFLERTRDNQQQAFNTSAVLARDTAYFTEHIAEITTAADLVADRRLLRVALGAFGLDDDISNKYFIQKILEDGTLQDDALANRLADKRYFAFSKAFAFGNFSVANTQLSEFPGEIVAAFQDRQFEIAIGAQNTDMRLALGTERDLENLLGKDTTANGFWFSVMGTPTLRRVFEVALGLPLSLGAIDIDQQLKSFRAKAEQYFGDGEVAQFSDPEKRQELIRLFLVRSDSSTSFTSTSPGSVAVALLANAGFSPYL